MFISYAQNFEDVYLWRALQHVENGFYVDIGANDPIIDSVTKSFYDKGWHGINVEPMQEYYQKLCQDRQNDINLNMSVSCESTDNAILYEISASGLSTTDIQIAAVQEEMGRVVNKVIVQSITLSAVCALRGNQPIHFLKIDVEGAEDSVLKSMDFSQCRPWIVIVEAIHPQTHTPYYTQWESYLTSAAYDFAFFDGLNRYYLAQEHSELHKQLTIPPNVLDGYVSYRMQIMAMRERELEQQWHEQERKKTELWEQLEASRMRVLELEQQWHEQERKKAELWEQLEALQMKSYGTRNSRSLCRRWNQKNRQRGQL